MTTTERPLAERVLDVVVYAPIGLALHLRDQHVAYVASGRGRFEQTVQVARLLGKMAVDQGQKEIRKRFDRCERPSASAPAPPPMPPARTTPNAPDRSPGASPQEGIDLAGEVPVEPASDTLITGIVVDATGPSTGAEDLPLADYDSLAASQVVLRLDDLRPDEIETVRAYEASHRARRTILAKITQLQAR